MPKRLTEAARRRRSYLKYLHQKNVRRRKRPATSGGGELRKNPSSALRDVGEFVGAGFAGYAGTRLVSRVAYVQVAKRSPKWARHASVGASVGAALAAYYLLGKVKKVERHHLPVSVGAAIAALQTVVQTYVPKFGWIVSDYQPTLGSASAPSAVPPQPIPELADDEDDIGLDPLSVTLGSLSGEGSLGSAGEKFSVVAGLDDDEGSDEFLSN